MDGNDGILDVTYYDLVLGNDVTVYPSYYEPWGYTPLESVAFGVPTVTTTLSGFGQWILSSFKNDFDDCGVNVISRGDYNYNEVSEQIAQSLKYLVDCGETASTEIGKAAMKTAKAAAWSNFIEYYLEAFAVALGK